MRRHVCSIALTILLVTAGIGVPASASAQDSASAENVEEETLPPEGDAPHDDTSGLPQDDAPHDDTTAFPSDNTPHDDSTSSPQDSSSPADIPVDEFISAPPGALGAERDGLTYSLRPLHANSRVLDISGASRTPGQAAILWPSQGSANQRFTLEWDAATLSYYLHPYGDSKLVLDVRGGSASRGAAIIQWTKKPGNAPASQTANQRWYLLDAGTEQVRIISALATEQPLALDCEGAADKNGARLLLWTASAGKANQTFELIDPAYAAPRSQVDLPDGVYRITDTSTKLSLDISGASTAAGAAVIAWPLTAQGTSTNQLFYLKRQGSYYSLRALNSALALDISGNDRFSGSKLIQWSGGAAKPNQLFSLQGNASAATINLSYTRRSLVALGQGKGVSTTLPEQASRFAFVAVSATDWLRGTGLSAGSFVSIKPAAAPSRRLDVSGSSKVAGSAFIAWTANASLNQKFVASDNGDGTWSFAALHSGRYLSASGTPVANSPAPTQGEQAITGTPKANERWTPYLTYGGLALVNQATATRLACSASGTLSLVACSGPSNLPQDLTAGFVPLSTLPIESGSWIFTSPTGLRLDLTGGSGADGTALELWTANSTYAQVFQVATTGSGGFVIKNYQSGKPIGLTGDTAQEGAALVQRPTASASTAPSQWTVDPSGDGWFFLRSVANPSLYVACSPLGTSPASGTRLALTSDRSQALRLSPTKMSARQQAQQDAARARSALSSASGARSVSGFGGYIPSYVVSTGLQSAVNSLRSSGYDLGFIMVDLVTGRGVAYNADTSFFGASTIKGPYVASVLQASPSSRNAYASTMLTTIRDSSNEGYSTLRNAYGSGPIATWCSRAGVRSSIAQVTWPSYSARELAKLWTSNYEFFFGEYEQSSWGRSLYTSSSYSMVYQTLGGSYTIYSKPGWMFAYPCVTNDAAIVMAGDHPYLVTVMSTVPGQPVRLSSLVQAINTAHQEMIR